MANIPLGIGVVFGADGSATVTGALSGIGTLTLQSQTRSSGAEKDVIKNAEGVDTQATIYNQTQECTLEYYPSGTTLALALAANIIPAIGEKVTIASAAKDTALNQTTWFVWNDVQLASTNTSAFRVTLHLRRWTGTNGIVAVTT